MSKDKRFYIGIDPGVDNGLVVWDSKIKTYKLLITFSTCALLDFLVKKVKPKRNDYLVIVEDPGLNKPVFDRGKMSEDKYKRIAQNVGMNKCRASIVTEYCQYHGIDFEIVRPSTAKWDHNFFKATTRMHRRYSQHVRDAVKLVHGL